MNRWTPAEDRDRGRARWGGWKGEAETGGTARGAVGTVGTERQRQSKQDRAKVGEIGTGCRREGQRLEERDQGRAAGRDRPRESTSVGTEERSGTAGRARARGAERVCGSEHTAAESTRAAASGHTAHRDRQRAPERDTKREGDGHTQQSEKLPVSNPPGGKKAHHKCGVSLKIKGKLSSKTYRFSHSSPWL